MNSLSKLSNLKSINKSSNLLRKNFCAVARRNELDSNLQVFLYIKKFKFFHFI